MATQLEKHAELRERYERMVLECFYLMLAGTAFAEMRRRWLRRFRRRTPFASMDDWVEADWALRKCDPDTWWRLRSEIGTLSEAYGLAIGQVTWALFVKGFHPRDPEQAGWQFPLDTWDPQIRLVVRRAEPQVIEKIVGLSAITGILVELRSDARPEDNATPDFAGTDGISISLEIPLEYPPDLAVIEARRALGVSRHMLRFAGMLVPMRVRGSASRGSVSAAIVTHAETSPFVKDLSSVWEGTMITVIVEAGQPSIGPTWEDGKTPLALGRLRLEFGAMVKSKDLTAGVRKSIREVRSLLKEAGLTIGQRLRPAPLVADAKELHVDGKHLVRYGLGDLVENHYGFSPRDEGVLTPEGKAALSEIKSHRASVKRRARNNRVFRLSIDLEFHGR